MWMVSLGQYVTEDLETHQPLDICVLINFIHTKKGESVINCKTLIGISLNFIVSLSGARL